MSSNKIQLYHTGHQEIKEPNVNYGRSNADFGQGFYLSDSRDFAERWANERSGENTYINIYELDLTDLDVVRFTRDTDWFDYIFKNRMGQADIYASADVIIGPIANDTLYDTYGLITSGLLKPDEALELLKIGSEYRQVALKTEKAAKSLKWLSSQILEHDDIIKFRELVKEEEAAFQEEFGKALQTMPCFADIEDILS